MEVMSDHRALEQRTVVDPGTINPLLRRIVLGIALAIGGSGCGNVGTPPGAINAQRTSLIGKTIQLQREGREDLVVNVLRSNGAIEIIVGNKTYVIPEHPLVPGMPIGESISNVEMDDKTVWITSSYADIELTRAEATRVLEQLETFDGDTLSGNASVVMTPKDATLEALVCTQRLFTGTKHGDTESYPIGFSRKKPDRELALQHVQPR